MSSVPKEIIFEQEARNKLVSGINKLFDVISVTLGPKGRTVGLESSFGSPKVTNDSNQILSELEFKDQYQNMGASLAKEVVEKIKDLCGDGSTRAIILFQALVTHGIKNISSGASPILVKRGIDKALALLLSEIDSISYHIDKSDEIKNIATASASGDQQVGSLIAQAFEQSGRDGVITIEEGSLAQTCIETVEGMQIERGYLSSYFCTDPKDMSVELTNPKILITDKKISSAHEIMPILQTISTEGKELLLIADDIEADALSTLVVNKLQGILKVAAIKAPGFGDRRKELLKDLAVVTGSTVVSDDMGMDLKKTDYEMLGSAKKVKISKDSTTLIGGTGASDTIANRIKEIDNELNVSISSYDKEKLLERKAKLSGGISVIKVGAVTEVEMKQKKQLFEDSLSSTKAAIEDGVVPGGCISLLKCSQILKEIKFETEEKIGADILFKACSAPFKQLLKNSGLESSLIVEDILSKDFNIGFDVIDENTKDLVKAGILDPAKVEKTALIQACSMAGVVLLSEALIGTAED